MKPAEMKAIRERFKMSQIVFSKLTGMGVKTIARYEHGTVRPSGVQLTIYQMLRDDPKLIETMWELNQEKLTEGERSVTERRLKGVDLATSLTRG